jgi:glutamine synthetase
VEIVWVDNCGIPRARIAPIERLEAVARLGVGITTLSAVFDSHDVITYAHPGLATPSGDVRLLPVVNRIRQLAGQPHLAWAPGYVLSADGQPWPYDPRGALDAQVRRAAGLGIEIRAGYELEFFVGEAHAEFSPAHAGPAYSAQALTTVDGFVASLLSDLPGNGLRIGQLHAEYGLAQLELSLASTDPMTAADDQLLARQTIHAAALAHGLRVSFAPLVTDAGVGQGWHVHTSVWRGGENAMTGDGPNGLSSDGAGWLAGLLRDLPAISAITAPSVPSLTRVRPGYFAGAFAFWGIQNREAPLRLVPATPFLGADHANVELKVSDASANPYLALTAVLAAGLAGIEEKLEPGGPIQEDPGTWSDSEREAAGLVRLPSTPEEQEPALTSSRRVVEALGPERLGAFLAVRRSDAAWAAERELDQVVEAHRWRY